MTDTPAIHWFITSESDKFLPTVLENLTMRGILAGQQIRVVLYASKRTQREDPADAFGEIPFFLWPEDRTEVLSQSYQRASVNSLSLTPQSAEITEALMDAYSVRPQHVHILITDDEVARWHKNRGTDGKPKVCRKAQIDDAVLRLLGLPMAYITPYYPWGQVLQGLLGNQARIINAFLPYSILSYEAEADLAALRSGKKPDHPDTQSVMLFSKKVEEKVLRHWIRALIGCLIRKKTCKRLSVTTWLPIQKLGFFTLLHFRLAISLARLRKARINFQCAAPMPPERYFLLLLEQDILVLQGRGGFSSSRTFCQQGGEVWLPESSPNTEQYQKQIGAQPITYGSARHCWEMLLEAEKSAADANSESIRNKINSLMLESEKTLKSLWSAADNETPE